MSNSTVHDAPFPLVKRYMVSHWNCKTVLIEPSLPMFQGGEIPDLYGYADPMNTHVIDHKVSESDAIAHMSKPHVLDPRKGMGVYRWILADEDLRVVVPEGWGLLRLVDDSIRVSEEGRAFPVQQRNWMAEMELLHRQAQKGGGDSEAGRRSQRGHIPAKYHLCIAGYANAYPGCFATEVAHTLSREGFNRERRGTVAKWIAQDARNGLIPGVRAEGVRAQLYPTD